MLINSNTSHFFLTVLFVLMLSYSNDVYGFPVESNNTDVVSIDDLASYIDFLNNEVQNPLVVEIDENDSEESNVTENELVGNSVHISAFARYSKIITYSYYSYEDILITKKVYILYQHLKVG